MSERDQTDAPLPPYDFLTGESKIAAKIQEYHEPLRRVPLFANLGDDDLDLMARLVREFSVESDTQLMAQGTEGSELLLIRSGRVRIERDGHVIAHLGVGEHVGELSLLDGKQRSASVYADSPVTLLVIQKHTFDYVLQSNPALKDTLLITLTERLRELQEELVH
jgi:CRP-like cAMP-binding protein